MRAILAAGSHRSAGEREAKSVTEAGQSLRLVRKGRVNDNIFQGDVQIKERHLTYEEMLQESRRAYVQLDEHYKSIVEKLQQEKTTTLKQFEKTYQ